MRLQLQDMDMPANIFVDLVELDDLSAEGIVHSLLLSLERHNFTKEYLSKQPIAITTDAPQ